MTGGGDTSCGVSSGGLAKSETEQAGGGEKSGAGVLYSTPVGVETNSEMSQRYYLCGEYTNLHKMRLDLVDPGYVF